MLWEIIQYSEKNISFRVWIFFIFEDCSQFWRFMKTSVIYPPSVFKDEGYSVFKDEGYSEKEILEIQYSHYY